MQDAVWIGDPQGVAALGRLLVCAWLRKNAFFKLSVQGELSTGRDGKCLLESEGVFGSAWPGLELSRLLSQGDLARKWSNRPEQWG